MNKRLQAIYSLICQGRGVVDVGTDHGYIPVALAQNGYAGKIIASDIRSGPLQAARSSAESAGVEEKIDFLLCDGLDSCKPEMVDTIIVAGMGGDTITGILDRAEWCAREDIKLILQPVTKAEILRYWLVNNDFVIKSEAQVMENGTVYQIICAVPGRDCKYMDAELFIGRYELIKNSPFFDNLLSKHIKRFASTVDGLKTTDREELLPWLGLVENILNELKMMREWKNENR